MHYPSQKSTGLELPVAYLTCNFSAPVGNKPALFTHDEVTTMFHEFGHGLHHMLTQVEEYGVSGIKGVEWDAVELPSQFMENFCWEWEVLRNMTAHVETGAQLPRELFNKMIAAKNFQAGMQTVRQIEFSLFDMRLHGDFDPNGKLTALDVIAQVRDEVAVLRPPKWNRFPNSFSHIFAGGYAQAITATNGQKCYQPMLTACLKSLAYCLMKLAVDLKMKCWPKVAQGLQWNRLLLFVAENLVWMRC